jgi:hypothetical protein
MATVLGKSVLCAVAVPVVMLERKAGTRLGYQPGARGVVTNVKRNLQLRLVTSPDVHDKFLVRKRVTAVVIDGDRSGKRFAAEFADGAKKRIVRRD